MKEFTVKSADTLKNFTDNTYPQGSFYFSALLKKRNVRVNGVRVGGDVPLAAGDRVTYYTTPAQEEKQAFRVLYQDENVLVADKESGVNSEAVYAVLSASAPCFFIHRLDRNTQGLMIFGKTQAAADCLLSAFRTRRVTKIYHAVCAGVFPKESAVLTAYLKKNAGDAFVKISDRPAGEKIVTEYRILGRARGLNFVEVTLHTGKTHQIRAHLAHIGCPVLGDTKYGDRAVNARCRRTRQCLAAKKLILHAGGVLAYLDGREFVSAFDVFAPFSENQP